MNFYKLCLMVCYGWFSVVMMTGAFRNGSMLLLIISALTLYLTYILITGKKKNTIQFKQYKQNEHIKSKI